MSESSNYQKAANRVDDKIKFYRHLSSYVVVNLILFIINFLFSREYWWCLWVILFWGIGLLINFLRVFVFSNKFGEDYRERKIQEELDKMDK